MLCQTGRPRGGAFRRRGWGVGVLIGGWGILVPTGGGHAPHRRPPCVGDGGGGTIHQPLMFHQGRKVAGTGGEDVEGGCWRRHFGPAPGGGQRGRRAALEGGMFANRPCWQDQAGFFG
jgi:hypothetical protein